MGGGNFILSFLTVYFEFEEIILGALLKVKAIFENVKLVFLNICHDTNFYLFLNTF